MVSKDTFGQHLAVDAAGCNVAIRDREAIARFARDLVDAISMKAYGSPLIEHFGHGDRKTSGHTLVQLIETSHIACHFCDHTSELYLDVFSCKRFDSSDVLRVVDAHFAPETRAVSHFSRQAPRIATATLA